MSFKRLHSLAPTMLGLGLIVAGLSIPAGRAGPAEPDPAVLPAAREFIVDSVHSSLVFRVKHLQVANFYGRFNEISGSFRVDESNPKNSYIRIKVPAASVDSKNADRDKHLKSQDFFSAREFPHIVFKSTKIERTGKDAFRVTGDLTFRGVTKSITFDAMHTGTAAVSERFGLRSGYEAIIDIKRSDFGVTYGLTGNVLGDEVRLIVSLEGSLSE